MTAKQFFKSQAFKCIAVLLSIILVCGILLTVCNSLFYVSAEEKRARAISKIYGKQVETSANLVTDETTVNFSSAIVNEAYKVIDDGNYLIKSTGKQGFGGDVTCWVVVRMDGNNIAGAGKIAIDKAAGESYVSKIDASELAAFSEIEYTEGYIYELGKGGKDYIETGASYTMRAISNAVNGAIAFVNVNILGGEFVKDYSTYIDKELTTWEIDGDTVKYDIHTTGEEPYPFHITIHVDGSGTITEYVVLVNGSSTEEHAGEDYGNMMSPQALNLKGKTLEDVEGYLENKGGVLSTGATRSNTVCYEAAAYALTEYEKIMNTDDIGGEAQ